MSWVLWGQLPSLQRAACKIRLLRQGDWRYPWRFSPFTEYCELVISHFFRNRKTTIPNIRYFVTVSWLGINRAWKTMKGSSASQLSIFPGSWNLFPCGLYRCKKCSSHTHLSWNTTCIGTALFLTVLFQGVSDLCLIPQQLCPWTLVWFEAGRGKHDSTTAAAVASLLWDGDTQVVLPPRAGYAGKKGGADSQRQPRGVAHLSQTAAQKSCWQWCRDDGPYDVVWCPEVVMLHLMSTKTVV